MSKPWSKDMKLDPGTFGGSPACKVLVQMMNNNIIPIGDKHRVLSFINDAIYQFKWLSSISEYRVVERSMTLMRNYLDGQAAIMPYPWPFNSHLRNVISYHHKRYLGLANKTWKKKLGQSLR